MAEGTGGLLMKLRGFFGYKDVASFRKDWAALTPEDKEELLKEAVSL